MTVKVTPLSVGSGSPWVSVKDHGALGQGASNDTAAFQAAIAALPNGGILYVPQGYYAINQALVLAQPITVQGAGLAPGGINKGSQIVQVADATHVFDVQSDWVTIRDLSLSASGFTPTSGAGIHQTSGLYTNLQNVGVANFWNNIQFDAAAGAALINVRSFSPVNYGMLWRNVAAPDQGDSTMTGCYFSSPTGGAAAGLRYESSGGLKFYGNKIIGHKRGIDLQIPDGAATIGFPIVACSIENQTLNCIRIGRSGTTGTWSKIQINGNHIGGYLLDGAANVIELGAGISEVAIAGNTLTGTANTTGMNNISASAVMVSANAFASHSVGIQNGGTLLGHKSNAFFNVATPYAGAGTLATTD